MGRRRVLAVSNALGLWGAELSLLRLAVGLREQGIDMTLASPPGGSFEITWRQNDLLHLALAVEPPVGVRPHGERERPPLRSMLSQVPRTWSGAQRLTEHARGFDLIHSNSLLLHPEATLAARRLGRPVVLELHEMVEPGYGAALLGLAIRGSRGAMAVSAAVAERVPSWARAKVSVVPQAVDVDAYRPGRPDQNLRAQLGGPGAGQLLGVVGRLGREKRLDVAFRAVSRLLPRWPSLRLAVIGDTDENDPGHAAELRTLAGQLGGGAIRFVGRQDDMPAVLRCLDILVHCRTDEAFGLAVLEAQAVGVPVVVPDTGGPPEFVTDRVTGMVTRAGDEADLARAVGELLEGPDRAAEMGRAASSEAARLHSLARRVETVTERYSAALSSR